MTQRPFEELNLWQRIFMEHWTGFAASYEREHGRAIPEHWQENVERMLSCGDIREGYYGISAGTAKRQRRSDSPARVGCVCAASRWRWTSG